MANEEQLAILKQGVKVWNKWRKKNSHITIDLSRANVNGADLSEANLVKTLLWAVNLEGAILNKAFLIEADLRQANLNTATFRQANLTASILTGATLRRANLRAANLSRAHLVRADLWQADLSEADLSGADLSEALLFQTNLSEANLLGSNFSKAELGTTVFGNLDLSVATGLEDVVHRVPSSISSDVFALSKGKIPEVFLRGCGLRDWEIESVKLYNPDLSNEKKNEILYKMYELLAGQALQISPLFISYSHGDGVFVDKLEGYLNKKGIRFWRDVHDATAGRLEKQIDRAMRLNPTVLLILSDNSLKSDWVEHEVKEARKLEKELGRDVLCPIALDDSWKTSPWPKRVMEQVMEYNILDFSVWKEDDKFGSIFNKLIDGLELFYK